MQFKFILAKFKIHPKVPDQYIQWFLLIDTVEAFMAFIEGRRNKIVRAYSNLKDRTIRQTVKSGHIADSDESLIFNRLYLDDSRKSLLDDANILEGLLEGYHKAFLNEGHIIVSPNNSFRMMDDTFKILETRYNDTLIFPVTKESDIRIIQWPNGKHYYAKIGNQDVVDAQGNRKWDSFSDAKYAAQRYLDKHLVGVK